MRVCILPIFEFAMVLARSENKIAPINLLNASLTLPHSQ